VITSDAVASTTREVSPLPEPIVERSDYYLKVLSFVISNAWMGENMAIQNYSEMVPLMESVESKIEAVGQAHEEAKHVLMLEKLARRLGFEVDPTMVEDEWASVRDSFHEAAGKGDLAACLIIQDLMVESLAIGLYSTFADEDNKDWETSKVATGLLEDELRHLDIGIGRIRELMARQPEAVHDSLVWAHGRVMPKLFQMVHHACDFLCERKGVPCESEMAFVQNGELHLDGRREGTSYIDLNRLKIASLESYIGMLDNAAFDPRIVNQLVASMAAYEIPGRDTGVRAVVSRA
jgi:fatty aldehyde decarbonylase